MKRLFMISVSALALATSVNVASADDNFSTYQAMVKQLEAELPVSARSAATQQTFINVDNLMKDRNDATAAADAASANLLKAQAERVGAKAASDNAEKEYRPQAKIVEQRLDALDALKKSYDAQPAAQKALTEAINNQKTAETAYSDALKAKKDSATLNKLKATMASAQSNALKAADKVKANGLDELQKAQADYNKEKQKLDVFNAAKNDAGNKLKAVDQKIQTDADVVKAATAKADAAVTKLKNMIPVATATVSEDYNKFQAGQAVQIAKGGTASLAGGGNLVAAGGGNAVPTNAGNLVAAGGGNLVAAGGGNLVAAGGGNAVPTNAGNLVAAGGGNLVAAGGGNLVAAGGGNAVPTNAGNLVAAGGGNLVAAGGGNAVPTNAGNLVAAGGGNLVAAGGGNLVAAGGGNLVAAGGGNLVAAGGGNLVAAGGGNLVAAGGGNLVAAGGGNAVGVMLSGISGFKATSTSKTTSKAPAVSAPAPTGLDSAVAKLSVEDRKTVSDLQNVVKAGQPLTADQTIKASELLTKASKNMDPNEFASLERKAVTTATVNQLNAVSTAAVVQHSIEVSKNDPVVVSAVSKISNNQPLTVAETQKLQAVVAKSVSDLPVTDAQKKTIAAAASQQVTSITKPETSSAAQPSVKIAPEVVSRVVVASAAVGPAMDKNLALQAITNVERNRGQQEQYLAAALQKGDVDRINAARANIANMDQAIRDLRVRGDLPTPANNAAAKPAAPVTAPTPVVSTPPVAALTPPPQAAVTPPKSPAPAVPAPAVASPAKPATATPAAATVAVAPPTSAPAPTPAATPVAKPVAAAPLNKPAVMPRAEPNQKPVAAVRPAMAPARPAVAAAPKPTPVVAPKPLTPAPKAPVCAMQAGKMVCR